MRWLKHLFSGTWQVRRAFPPHAMRAIEADIRAGETSHLGEIRFAVEAGLDIAPLMRGQTARARAIEVFSDLHVWDTEHNNGVLVYLLLADHDVEVVADRGIDSLVGPAGWQRICTDMETLLRAGRFEDGVRAGLQAISERLAQHFPAQGGNDNELPDAPVVL